MKAEIISIGTLFESTDRLLTQEFSSCGMTVTGRQTIENTDESLSDALGAALRCGDFVCVCGKPNARVAQTMARTLGLPLQPQEDENALPIPRGATAFSDEQGVALGFAVKKYGQLIFLLPANVDQLVSLCHRQIVPFFEKESGGTFRSHTVGVFGLSDAAVTERISDLLAGSNPAVSLFPNESGEILLRITAHAADVESADALCTPVIDSLCERLRSFVFGVDVSNLQTAVVQLLKEKKLKIATAESCTAGLLSGKLTQVAGASAVFECGIAAYSKEIKRDVLGVSADVLNTQGAVCADTAAAMASGARRVGASDIGVSVTGEAGPESSENKPVGTVFIALADSRRVWVKEINVSNAGRDTVRKIATCHALDLARRYLDALPAVMAGGRMLENANPTEPAIPKAAPVQKWRFLSSIFPWKGNRPAALIGKSCMWVGILALIAAAVMVVNTYVLFPARNREQYVSLALLYTQEPDSSLYSAENFPDGMLARFYALYEKNPDIKGWIQVPNTQISYPVVQNAALDYSSLNFSREYSEYGVPYFDETVSLTSPLSKNRTFVIHGNSTADDQMFSALLSYTDADFLLKHPTIEMNTIYSTGTFEVFAVLYIDENEESAFDYRTNAFQNDEDFLAFCAALNERSLYITSTEPDADDTLLLLETDAASKTGENGIRLIVAARMLGLGETAQELILSQNPTPLLPAVMQRAATSTATLQASATTVYQSSDEVPDIDMPETDPTTQTQGSSVTTTGASSEATTAESTTMTTGSTTLNTSEKPATTTSSSQGSTTTAIPSTVTTTTSPTVSAGSMPVESAFYSTITVRIGNNAATPIRSREELQYAVACLVKAEMGAARSMANSTEAQKAQAIAGYTYMLYSCRNGGVFTISSAIDLTNANDKKIYDAVGEVVGMKLADTAQTTVSAIPLCAMYFSSCNGATASCQNVYTAALPYLQSVHSAYDTEEYVKKYSGGSSLTSTYTTTWTELKAKLDAYVSNETDGDINEVSLKTGGSTPLYATTFDGNGGYVVNTNAYYVYQGKTVYLRGIDIRKAIGSSVLRSHSFTIFYDTATDQMTFTVKGHGHALGLSQYGAIGYANEAGWSYRQILNHYYSLSDTGRYRIVSPVWD